MSPKQLVILSLIVCLPLALLGWLGVRLARDEQTVVQENVRDLLAQQLRETDQSVVRHFQRLETELLELTEGADQRDRDHLRELVRNEPRITQVFVLEADGRVQHPDVQRPLNASEKEFIARAKPFLEDKDLTRGSARSEASSQNLGWAPQGMRNSASRSNAHGWYVWFWERGVNLIFWRRTTAGRIVGVELVRARWMADLIVVLPQTPIEESQSAHSRIRLTDSNNNVVYQWGGLEPKDTDQPFVVLPLSAPLSTWRLKYFVAEARFDALSGRSAYFNTFTGLAALAVGVVGLAIYFYRESSRELREAATRVNFVNQVSHELKTPLTNIRMYAELLERDLDASPGGRGKPHDRLRVILAESGRLGRLIGNVLTFSSQQRHQMKLKPTRGVVDDVIDRVLELLQPSLTQAGVEIELDKQASQEAAFDADVVEQVLVNLLSNVEKYAAQGKYVRVESQQHDNRVSITISDRGPGIKNADCERVFQPFYRGADQLEEAAGAGIGLSISRSLARLHGGDVKLLPVSQGASFQFDFVAEPISTGS